MEINPEFQQVQDFWVRHAENVAPYAMDWYRAFFEVADRGHELILGERGLVVGMLLKGQDEVFSEVIDKQLAQLSAPKELRNASQALAKESEYRNSFCKLEWDLANHKSKVGIYHRQRFPVAKAMAFLKTQGVADPVLEQLELYAKVLERPSIHFLALAARQGEPFHWKAYFTQWVNPNSWAAVLRKLLTVLEMAGVSPDSAGLLAARHAQLLPFGVDRNLFISFNFDKNQFFPQVKLDYEKVKTEQVLNLVPTDHQTSESERLEALLSTSPKKYLSYLGVKIQQKPGLLLKYYQDSLSF